jgi:putative sterol carrier protein
VDQRARPPEDILPAYFFECWVPEAVAADEDRCRKLGDTEAKVVFTLSGEGGGVFTVAIGDGEVRGREGGVESPDLRVELDMDTWRSLNAGRISAPEAILKRRMHFHGSFLLGLKLHLILG